MSRLMLPVPSLSTIICSHNPRADYFERVLAALRAQTLPPAEWELLVVDNASATALADRSDISWHPHARHIREDELGLTPARLRGIAEAAGGVLVFVDDDNVLGENYLENVLAIAREYPFLGAWGGAVRPEFERPPDPRLLPLLSYLSLRSCSEPVWSNNRDDWRARPCGAGLCVRMAVAGTYARQVAAQPARRRLDRVGSLLSSCGDTDLVDASTDIGLGFGSFPQLLLTHLIPKARLEPTYLYRLIRESTASLILLRHLRAGELPRRPNPLGVAARTAYTLAVGGRHQARAYLSTRAGIRDGINAAGRFAEANADRAGDGSIAANA